MSCLFHFISSSSKDHQKDKPPRLPPVKVKPTFCIYDSSDSDDNNNSQQKEFPLLDMSPYLLYQDCCLSDTFFVLLDSGKAEDESMRCGERSSSPVRSPVRKSVSLPYIPRAQSRYPAVRCERTELVIIPLISLTCHHEDNTALSPVQNVIFRLSRLGGPQ